MPNADDFVAAVLGGLLTWTAVAKFQNRAQVAAVMRSWSLFAPRTAWRLSGALPWTELVLGIGILMTTASGRLESPLRLGASGLFATFVLGQAFVLSRGVRAPCGCGGGSSSQMGPASMLKDGSLCCLALVIAVAPA